VEQHAIMRWWICMLLLSATTASTQYFIYISGGQTTAQNGILCGPQGSHGYINSTYF